MCSCSTTHAEVPAEAFELRTSGKVVVKAMVSFFTVFVLRGESYPRSCTVDPQCVLHVPPRNKRPITNLSRYPTYPAMRSTYLQTESFADTWYPMCSLTTSRASMSRATLTSVESIPRRFLPRIEAYRRDSQSSAPRSHRKNRARDVMMESTLKPCFTDAAQPCTCPAEAGN